MAAIKYEFEVDYDNDQITIEPQQEPTTDQAYEIRKEIEKWYDGFDLVWPEYSVNLSVGEQTF